MKQLYIIYQAELIKLKNSSVSWLIVASAAFIPIFFVINIMHGWEEYLRAFASTSPNPWNEYSRKFFNGEHFTFLPMLVVLVISLVFNIEYKSSGWKNILVLPANKSSVFAGKYLVLFTLIILFYFLMIAFYLLGGIILGVWKPQFGFLHYFPSYQYGNASIGILPYLLKSFISVLAILAIHFWLSFRLKNTFIVIVIGLAGVVTAMSMYISHWESIKFFPYGLPVLMCNYVHDDRILSDFQLYSMFYFIFVSVLSYFDFILFFRGQ